MQVASGLLGATALVLLAITARAEIGPVEVPLDNAASVTAHNVTANVVNYGGGPALEVRLAGTYRGPDTDTFAFIPSLDFHDGTIDVDVAGSILSDGPPGARGFVGIAFRVDAKGGSFASEGFYVRPSNGRAEDQLRRNHATQYFSYPGFDFDRLRQETPGKYEAYVDLVIGEWTHMKIDVSGAAAKLYVGSAQQPVLIVNDLKRGADAHGTIGLWVDNGTDGHFRNLVVRPR